MMFLDELALSPETRRVSESLFRNWIGPAISNRMTPVQMVNFWVERDLKPETIRKLLNLYNQWYFHRHGTKLDFGKLIKKINRNQITEEPKAWNSGEAHRALFVTRSSDPYFHDLLLVTLHTGMRKGELFGLCWEDVDLLNSRINVKRSWGGPTKTGKPRSIPMSKKVEEVFHRHYEVGATGVCFPKLEVNSKLKKLCEELGFKQITWHGLRHTFATLALEAGRSPRDVAHMLGHSKVSTTLDLYWSKSKQDMDLDFLPWEEI